MAKRAFLDVYQSRVATALAKAGTSLVLDSVTGLAAQDVLIIDEGNTHAEVVFVTTVTTTTKTATVVRGMAGTTDRAHAKGAIVKKVGWRQSIALAFVATEAKTIMVLPPKGILVKASAVLEDAITGTSSVITLSNKTDAITGGVITIAEAGSGAGEIYSCTPTLYNEFDGVADYLDVVKTGTSTGAKNIGLLLEFISVED